MTHQFCDHCPGCRPALIQPATGKVFADDSPEMLAVMKIWNHNTTYSERKAFINVTVNNSRKSEDLKLSRTIMAKIHSALADLAPDTP